MMIKCIKNIFGCINLKNPNAKINNKETVDLALIAVTFFSASFILTNALPVAAYYSLISCGSVFGLIFASRVIQSCRLSKRPALVVSPNEKIVAISGEIYEKILESLKNDRVVRILLSIEYRGYEFHFVDLNYGRGIKAKKYLKEFYKNSDEVDHYHSLIILASSSLHNMTKNSLARFASEVDLDTRLAIAQLEEIINVTFSKGIASEIMKGQWPSKEAFEAELRNFYRPSDYLLGNLQ